jgi:hypothetical protein
MAGLESAAVQYWQELELGADYWMRRAKKAEAQLARMAAPQCPTTTKTAGRLLEFIQLYMKEQGTAPSFEEMRVAMRLKSKSGIHRLITSLEERGRLKRLRYRARAMELVQQ